VKKCASCTKDLPEAALHCVFCGAKQPPVATSGVSAKTAFGYSANEVMQQLGRPGTAAPAAPAPSAAPTYQPQTNTAPYGAQVPHRSGPSQPPPMVPTSSPHAQTVAILDASPPAPALAQAPLRASAAAVAATVAQTRASAPAVGTGPMSGGMGINAPNSYTPPALPVVAQQPYLSSSPSQVARIAGDPWLTPLRVVMFMWGLVLLAVFATPLSLDPLTFHWDGIDKLGTTGQLLTLLSPAIGLLAVIMSLLPMPTRARGVLAALLGLAGLVVPIVIIGELPAWQLLLVLGGTLVLFVGLLLRNTYTDSLLARALVTAGVICVLLPYLVPLHGEIALVNTFKVLVAGPSKARIMPIVEVVLIALVVMSLLAWIPPPATGGAKVFAWTILLWDTAARALGALVATSDIVEVAKATPAGLDAWAELAALVAIAGYGLATTVSRRTD
jgi:hypothetical protein